MDYVVFGTGYGATLLLLGWALRTFGPGFRHASPDHETVESGDRMLAKLSWSRFAAGLGTLIATAGAALILVIFVTMLINPGDDTGSLIAWVSFGLILLAIGIWSWIFVGRYGVYGILPEHQETSSVFRSGKEADAVKPARIRGRVASSTVVTAEASQRDAPVSGRDAHVLGIDDGSYAAEDEYVDDDEFEDERESRYARYQVHHPDEGRYSSLFDSGERAHVDDEPYEPESTDVGRQNPDDDGDIHDLFDSEDEFADNVLRSSADVHSSNEGVTEEESATESSSDDDTHSDVSEINEIEGIEDSPSENIAGQEVGDEVYLDVLERTNLSSDESGRADALRNLRARRSGKALPE